MSSSGKEKKTQKGGAKAKNVKEKEELDGELSDSSSIVSDASTIAGPTSEIKQMELLQASMALMMEAMTRNEAYRQEEAVLRREELDRLREDAKLAKMELEAQKAAQLAQHEAEKLHWAKEEENRRKYEEKYFEISEENRKKREALEIDLNQRRENDREKERQDRISRDIVQQIPLWDDNTDAESYLEMFELAMQEAKLPEDRWVSSLRKRLTGKALATYREISPGGTSSFAEVKSDLLKRMGATVESARNVIWLQRPRLEDNLETFTKELMTSINRLKCTWETTEDAAQELFHGALHRIFHQETLLLLRDGTDDTPFRTAEKLRQIWSSRDYYGRRSMLRGENTFFGYRRPRYRDEPAGGLKTGTSPTVVEGEPYSKGGKVGLGSSGQGLGGGRSGTQPVQSAQGPFQFAKHKSQITCYNCNEKGHYKSECSKPIVKMARISSPEALTMFRRQGAVNGHCCSIILDTGADITAVPARLISEGQYTGETLDINVASAQVEKWKLADVRIEVDGYDCRQRVCVLPKDAHDVLLGIDHPLTASMRPNIPFPSVRVVTRRQKAQSDKELAADVAADKTDTVKVVPVDSDNDVPKGTQFDDSGSYQVEELIVEDEDDVASVLEEEGCASGLEGGLEAEFQPLPVLCDSKEGVGELIAQQMEDDSLIYARRDGEEEKDGFCFNKDGLLTHTKLSDLGKLMVRVVIPKNRRQEVLDIAHRGLAGGHFSEKRTYLCICAHFWWPQMRKSVKEYCAACAECQRGGKAHSKRVPLQKTPTISIPYTRMACDLVGPLPRTQAGFRYILTVMCLGTRYPFAIPLKRIDARTVAEGLMEVFSYTGIPVELLHDQGQVFVGKVTSTLCSLLNIKQLRTTAYHPQTNGILERWHGCLKNMLRKHEEGPREWDRLLKYCLLAYRATPHAATLFSPYELVHGRQLRGPLQALKEGWTHGDLTFKTSIEWVNQLRDTLAELQKISLENEEKFKKGTKEAYDKGTANRSYQLGDMVLLHTPSLSGSLSTVWEGPYEIIQILSPTTYKLSIPGKRGNALVTHVNRLKDWKIPHANVFSVVVAKDSSGSDGPVGAAVLGTPDLNSIQSAEMQALVGQFPNVISDKLGDASPVVHTVDTGQSSPIQVHPYRVAPAWREELRKEIFKLKEEGIITYSRSPWSAPMVPVQKSNGSIRLCIDYRALNEVTVPDPYQMPNIEDILSRVSEATWFSKLDMNRGFYQVSLDPTSQPKTAFCSPWGKFHFIRMPFGLRNAPASFQRCMDSILGHLLSSTCVYIDDVLVFSDSWDDHLVHVQQVLEALADAGLTANPSKCVWGARSLSYLGHMVGVGFISVPEARVKAIKEYQRPVTKRDLRAFLGTVGYYRRFIPGFAGRAGPLFAALKKGLPDTLCWSDDMSNAYQYLSNSLCSSSVLCLPRSTDHLTLYTDASYKGIGAVLSTVRDGEERPIGFYSKQLSPAEQNYAASEIECLAVVKSVDNFAIHLIGRPFTVVTDHRALTSLQSSRKLNGRLMRWALALQDYTFKIVHRIGSKHQNADGLSRQAWPSVPESSSQEGGGVKSQC